MLFFGKINDNPHPPTGGSSLSGYEALRSIPDEPHTSSHILNSKQKKAASRQPFFQNIEAAYYC
ncbi:MAG: hypothetical protein CVU05_02410 [Bacteroidetes bacterium HGW-Bacteroidetes-21]|jgi:hypothetical protein|nr:MAG: hypothetical protein CVU05_02410 [Bacteroidetes bacterium HGW-Bacteroidetes-21]